MSEEILVQENRPFDAKCSQHDCHPEECWDKHNIVPTDHRAETPEELNARIAAQHLQWQKEGGKPKPKKEENAEIHSDG
jgi:hypothetical protein